MLMQLNKVSLGLLLFFLMLARVHSTRDDVEVYLWKYGYLHPLAINGGLDENATRKALKDFQRFTGLNITKEFDEHVLKLMSQPRCGLVAKNLRKINKRLKRFAVADTAWSIYDLTYNITAYPDQLSRADVDAEIAKAFAMWSEHSGLTFTHDKTNRFDIELKFVENEHGDGEPFNNSYAHAYLPNDGGQIHFDKAAIWTIGSEFGINLLQIAVHEIGHSLGLDHSDLDSSVMYPFYPGYIHDFKLDDDDIDGIQYLYGPKSYDLCRYPKIDTIFNTDDGQIYVFKGKHYYKILENSVADGYPKLISEGWPGLPGNIDAAFTYEDGKTYFFKHKKYWRYNDRKLDDNYPRNIRKDFGRIPNYLDAAMVWGSNSTILFFKGHKFWSVTPENLYEQKFGIPLSIIKGLPRNIDAAFQHTNGSNYFFKGDKYYQLNNKTYHVDKAVPPYPRPSAKWWFGC